MKVLLVRPARLALLSAWRGGFRFVTPAFLLRSVRDYFARRNTLQ